MASESWIIVNNQFYVSFDTNEGDSKSILPWDATSSSATYEIPPYFKEPNSHYYVHRVYLLV